MTGVVTGYRTDFSTVKDTVLEIRVKALPKMNTDTSTANVQNTSRYTGPEKTEATMQSTSLFTAHLTVRDTAHDTCALTGHHI